MADVLQHRDTITGSNIYCVLRDTEGQHWDAANTTWETLVPASWTDYDITLSEGVAGSYHYTAAIPNVDKPTVFVDVYRRAGGGVAITDPILYTYLLQLDSSENIVTAGDNAATLATILADTNQLQTEWDNGGRLDMLIDEIKVVTDNLPDNGALTYLSTILTDTNQLQTEWDNGGRLDMLIDEIKAVTDVLPNNGALTDLTTILADTNELQQAFADVDTTGTETITGAKALELILAILGGNTDYDAGTRVFTIYGRNGTSELWNVTISNTVAGDRTDSTKV